MPSRPVIIEEPLWKFELDRQFSSFEGEMEWPGKLTNLANEWLAEDEEQASAALITKERFSERLKTGEIPITDGIMNAHIAG